MDKEFIDKWISQLKKGTLSFLVLQILKDQKAYYGYDLIQEIRKRTEIEVAEGTLYPLMNRLKEEKMVSSNWVEQNSGIPRKYYSITTLGIKTAETMSQYWISLNQALNSIK
ncbi:MAG: PadR family transcriptional regulator [Flavobacterium sp.]|nr:MAG: PadR family transcriptional regulator [Flavobacterium sp.]